MPTVVAGNVLYPLLKNNLKPSRSETKSKSSKPPTLVSNQPSPKLKHNPNPTNKVPVTTLAMTQDLTPPPNLPTCLSLSM